MHKAPSFPVKLIRETNRAHRRIRAVGPSFFNQLNRWLKRYMMLYEPVTPLHVAVTVTCAALILNGFLVTMAVRLG